MGEVFFKKIILFALFACCLFLLVGVIRNLSSNLNDDFEDNGDLVVYEDNLISGFAVHPIYNSFSLAESGFSFNNNSGLVSVADTVVYRVGYYSVNGASWQSFNLSGSSYNGNSNWLSGLSSKTLSSFGVGEHYVIIYSCTYSAGWDCHGNKWQLIVVNNTPVVPPVSSCSNGIRDGSETNVDCGGSCASCVLDGDYYVAPYGNDNNSGTINQPFATWEKLNSVMQPGDLAYIRGGTYRSTRTGSSTYHVRLTGFNGNANNYIKIWAYPGEQPILNFDNIAVSSSYVFGLILQYSSYVHVKGIRVTGLAQPPAGASLSGIFINDVTNSIIENVEVDHIGMYGFVFDNGCTNILVKNCDAHHLADPYSANPYGGANGFSITGGSTANNITFDGCRAWFVSDDGWDFFDWDGYATINNCWAFWNGYDESFNRLGDGQGFKLGPTLTDKSNVHLRTISNSVAAKNAIHGFDQNTNDYSTIMYMYNNLAYDNGNIGFMFSYLNGINNIFRNNIAYGNDQSPSAFGTGTIHSNNTWNSGAPTVNDADFISVDVSQLVISRKSNGDLPDITFGKLVSGSDLIDRGFNVGLPYNGAAPDLGAFESNYASSCTTHFSSSCYNGDVYWYNSCSVREEIRYDCTSTQTCTNNVCVNNSGRIFYLSPTGNDNNLGTISSPWFTLDRAWDDIQPGDTVYLRGGTYQYTKQDLNGKSGTSGNLIKVWAYPGETPVITKSSSYSAQWPMVLIYLRGDYFHFKGLEITGHTQGDESVWSGLRAEDSDYVTFELMNFHHNGNGMSLVDSNNCLILNSDFHHNLDPLTNPNGAGQYGNADGLGVEGYYGSTNTIRGCRFWWNTDDGLDLWDANGNIIIENSWAWYNGFMPDTFNAAGDGSGFKFGITNDNLSTLVLRNVRNSMAFRNKKWGFLDNGAKCNIELYNNVAYDNCYMGYDNGWCGGYHFRIQGIPYYVKNNIAYNNLGGSEAVLDILTNINHNSWDSAVSVSDTDFISIDMTGVDGARQADGSLPNLNFLKLAAGSDLIDKGVNIGLPYNGAAPDLGAYER